MTMFRVGPAGIPASLKTDMDAVLNKKFGTSTTYAPKTWPDNVNLLGALSENTASGSVAHVTDGADGVPLKAWEVTVPANLSGVSSLQCTQAKTNIFDGVLESGWIDNSGTDSPTSGRTRSKNYLPVKAGQSYYVTCSDSWRVYFYDTTQTFISYAGTYSANRTISAPINAAYFRFAIIAETPTGVGLNYPSTETTAQTPTAPTVSSVSLGRTIYGGTADVVTGDCEPTNWLDDTLANLEQGSINGSTGNNENANNRVRNASAIPFPYDEIASSYTWTIPSGYKVAIRPYDANGNFVQLPSWALAFITTLPQDLIGQGITQMKFVLAKTDNSDITPSEMAEIGYIINKGNTAAAYSPYFAPFTFTPITPTPETPLGVSNWWADEGDSAVTYRSSGTVTPVPVVPTLITKTITENDTYRAEDDNADGYSEVIVNVQGGTTPFVPQFTETLIGDNTAHAASFTLSEDYGNYDMVKIVWYESASVSGFLYTTPAILDEIFSVGVGKLCVNKPSTNYYICYTKSSLTWTQTNQRNIYVHEVYGVTFTNCTMTATDLYKRGASTTTKFAITSLTSLKDYDLFIMSSIHATDGSETMPATWLYQYPPENMSAAFSCPVPTVLQEYNANDEAIMISEYEMSAARYFMVQGITFTPN